MEELRARSCYNSAKGALESKIGECDEVSDVS